MNDRFFKGTDVSENQWKSHHGPIKVIDFTKTKSLQDSFGALGCITVLTSNGKMGTLTHLDTTDKDNIEFFVKALDETLQDNKQDSTVILSGGSKLLDSQNLVKTIKNEMKNNNYVIIGEYIDNKTFKPNPKITELQKDKIVIRQSVSTLVDQITEINFAQGAIKSYTQLQELPDFVKRKNLQR